VFIHINTRNTFDNNQPPFYGHHTGQPALAGTSTGGFCRCKVLLPACPADGNQCIRIREKMPEFSSAVLSEGKTKLDLNEAKDSEWQWHQLGHMQVCTLLQTDNHTSTLTTHVFYRPDALPAAQPTASKH